MGVPPPGARPCSPVPAAVLTPGAPLAALELSRSCGRAARPSAGLGRGGLGGGCPPEKWKAEGPGRPVALVQADASVALCVWSVRKAGFPEFPP